LLWVFVDGFEAAPELGAAGFVDLEEPVVGAEIAVHLAFAGVGGLTDVEGRGAVAEGDQRGMAFDADDSLRLRVDAGGFVGEPIGITPDDVFANVFGKRVDQDFFRHFDLVGHFGTGEDTVAGLADVGDDHVAELGVVGVGGAVVDGVADIVGGDAGFVADLVVGRVAEAGDDADELATLEVVGL
jgi:hypothetical protein